MMKQILMLLIRCYQKCISPLTPPCCRYYPTCSAYTLTAVERFGAVKGLMLGAFRLLRCHPWARGGIDEVPAQFPKINFSRIKQDRLHREMHDNKE